MEKEFLEDRIVQSKVAWAVAFLIYILLGYHYRTYFLNWIIGPLFPFIFLYLIPKTIRVLFLRTENK